MRRDRVEPGGGPERRRGADRLDGSPLAEGASESWSVTVVIPTCADAIALRRTIRSVLETAYTPLEIVVVENRPPSAGTREVVDEIADTGCIRYVEEPRRGASCARNTGLATASGDIVGFTDDDVIVDEAWIRNAVAAFASADAPTCVTGRIRPLSLNSRSETLFDQFATFDKGAERRVFRMPDSRVSDPLFPYLPGHCGSGANIFIKRDAAVAIAGFDQNLGPGTPPLGGEDLDLFVRLAHGGHTIVYDPEVTLLHEHPNTSSSLRRHAFGYGLGLTAMLFKQLLRGPERLKLLSSIPAGLRYGVDPSSRKNVMKTADYPRTLDLIERFGMLLGPAAYLVSVARSAVARPMSRRAAAVARYQAAPISYP